MNTNRIADLREDIRESMATPMHLILPASEALLDSNLGALYLGNLGAAVDVPLLESKNITHIVQVMDIPWKALEDEGYIYHAIYIEDRPAADLRPHLDAGIEFIRSNLGDGKSILVHCHQGVSRSASMVIAYLMKENQMSFTDALAYVQERRVCVAPNSGFQAGLRRFEAELHQKSPEHPPATQSETTAES